MAADFFKWVRERTIRGDGLENGYDCGVQIAGHPGLRLRVRVMRRIVPTMIVGASSLFREGLSRILGPAGFRVLASKSVLSEIDTGELPRADPCLLVVQCDDSCGSLIPQLTAIKQECPLIRVALLGNHWPTSEIAAAFRAGANAYFAEATASDEFVRT